MKDLIEYYEQEESTNIREVIIALLSKWYWFIGCGILGVALALFITRSQASVYQISASVLINDDPHSSGIDGLFGSYDLTGNSKVENHIGVIESYRLIEGALNDLDWQTSWYAEDILKDIAIYKGLPYNVIALDGAINPSYLPIKIYPFSDTQYEISVDGMYLAKGAKEPVPISFTSEGIFGKPFVNDLFGFTLYKSPVFEYTDLYFVFNNIEQQTTSYQSRLSVSLMEKKADMISLSVEDESAERAVDFLNALIDQYMHFGLDIKNRTSANVVSFIDSQVKGIIDSLDKTSDVFTSFRSKNKTVNLDKEALIVVQTMEDIESKYFMAKMRLDYYNNLRLYMNDESKMSEMATPSVVGVTDVALNALVVRLGDLYARRSVLASVAREQNPSIISLDREIVQVRVSLSHNLDNLALNAANEVNALKNRKRRVSSNLASLPGKEQKLINIKRDFDINNELFTFLLKRRAEAAITMASNVSDVQIIDRARINTVHQVGPKRNLNILIGLILGMSFPLVIILLKDFFTVSLQSRQSLEKISKLPIFGQISHKSKGVDLQVIKSPMSIISECFRSLRSKLHFLFKDEPHQNVISVHSAIPSEGKSFCAANLASIYAISGKTVLLVGCDLRKPRLYKLFDLDNTLGLSSILIDSSSLDKVVQKTSLKNLFIVCSGPTPPNPAELLGRADFAQFITEARARYDVVILDNAPSLLVTDSSVVSRYSDANLFVVRQHVTKLEHIKIINKMSEEGTYKNVGFIYNDVKNDISSYAYGYSGYGYYGNKER